MALIDISDKPGLGQFITKASRDPQLRQQLQDEDFATAALGEFLYMPEGPHKIRIHFDEEAVTHVILPLAADIDDVVTGVEAGGPAYPDDYVDRPLRYIDAVAEPMKALCVRIAEYTMGRCKT